MANEVEKIKIKELIRNISNLSLGSITFIMSPIIVLLGCAYFLGTYFGYDKKVENEEIIEAYIIEKPDIVFNLLQKTLKESQAIQEFEANRKDLVDENWTSAFSSFSVVMQNYLAQNKPENLKYCYRMFNRYKTKLYIPIEVSENKIECLVQFEYFDIRPILSEFEAIINKPISEVLSLECISKLKDDIRFELPNHYIVNSDTSLINMYIDDCFAVLRYKDIIFKRFSLIEEIGKNNNLEPIYKKPLSQGDYEETACEAYSSLILIKENNAWKVDQFKTILISRKNY